MRRKTSEDRCERNFLLIVVICMVNYDETCNHLWRSRGAVVFICGPTCRADEVIYKLLHVCWKETNERSRRVLARMSTTSVLDEEASTRLDLATMKEMFRRRCITSLGHTYAHARPRIDLGSANLKQTKPRERDSEWSSLPKLIVWHACHPSRMRAQHKKPCA